LGEVDGQVPKCHWCLKWKIIGPLTMGLCFHMARESGELVSNMGDTWCHEAFREHLGFRGQRAGVLNKCN
jgi:hypothetical protein